MAVKAYVFVETAPGKAGEVAAALQNVQGVEAADPVTGPYDVIVVASAASLNALGQRVVNKIQTIEGVVRTVTNVVVSL